MDPDLGIDWMIEKGSEIMSAKDLAQPLFRDISSTFTFAL
jgi:dTDP-4-dehydrorhamnose 3,5-epimerase-like enzyme